MENVVPFFHVQTNLIYSAVSKKFSLDTYAEMIFSLSSIFIEAKAYQIFLSCMKRRSFSM